jgi:hypothetical protein
MKTAPAGEAIDIARYAEVVAHLRRFPADKKDEVIARLGLRRRDWEAAAARWTAAKDAELESGKTDLTSRFGSVLMRTRKRLEAQRPTLESLGPLPGPAELEPAAEPAPPPLPPELARVEPAAAPVVVHEMPALRDAPSAGGPSLWARHSSERGRGVELPPSYVAMAPAAPAAPEPVSPALPALVARPASHLVSTMPLGMESPVAAMPFKAAPAAPAQAFQQAVAHAQAVQGPAEARPALGATVAVGAEVAAPALPPGVPDLTLPQYASLRVEIATTPDRVPQILSRYGVRPEGRDALEAHWRARFQADPLLRMMFARAYASYTAWLKANPAP